MNPNLKIIGLAAALVAPAALPAAGTFDQVPLLEGAGIPVLSRAVARDLLQKDLLGSTDAGVVVGRIDIYDRFPWVEARYMLAVSDPAWGRILYGEADRSLDAFDGIGSAFGQLDDPRGLAVDEAGRLYVADAGNRRILVFQTRNEFDKYRLEPLYAIDGLARPYDVAWSDGGTPGDDGDDLLYVADTGGNRVVRFELLKEGARRTAEIGALGGGPGRFAGPVAIAAGRFDGANTGDIFVADAHGGRIVRLRDEEGRLEWISAWDADHEAISSLDTDHWGNVYAAVPALGEVWKMSPSLEKVAVWRGGTGEPRSFHVPLLTVHDHRDGRTFRAGHGGGILVEKWSDSGGIRMARFGVEVRKLALAGDGNGAEFLLTDRADVTVEIVDRASGAVLAELALGELPAGTARVELPVGRDELRKRGGDSTLRVIARSTYEGGGSGTGEIAFAGSDAAPPPAPGELAVHPNPFNPSTTVRFTVTGGRPLPGRLDLYDAAGRLVATVAEGPFEPGDHAVAWNGTNSRGREVASGIYLARLELAGESSTATMVLLR